MPGPRVAFHTLGCKVNQYDTLGMERLFLDRGYQVVDFDELADVYVINSCAVTGRSEAKSRQAVRRAARQNPRAVVALVGCYPQVDARAVGLAEVRVVAGVGDRHRIVDLVEQCGHGAAIEKEPGTGLEYEELPASGRGGRTRALLKIQDGCDGYCTYCVVPLARGPVRSRPPEEVMREAHQLLEAGYREIVLTGIRLGAYGRDRADTNLAQLIAELGKLGPYRLRLSSLEPEDVSPCLLDALAVHPGMCPHLHLPLQSGSDRVLAAMGRQYRMGDYRRLLERVRERWPGAAISTDVIVGFPGENPQEFQETVDAVEGLAFSRLHVFKYSRRPGTPAHDLPGQIPAPVKNERSLTVIGLGRRLALEFHQSFVGHRVEVLVEEKSGAGFLQGLTGHYVRVSFPGPSRWCHQLVTVTGCRANAEGVEGEPVGLKE